MKPKKKIKEKIIEMPSAEEKEWCEYYPSKEDIKSFIKDLLSQQKAELAEKIDKMKINPHKTAFVEKQSDYEIYNSALELVLKLLEE